MLTNSEQTKLGTTESGQFKPPKGATRYRFDSVFGNVTVPALFANSDHPSKSLVVLFNGAINRSSDKDPREIFQRRTWSDEIESPLLFMADPTILPSNEIQIGWMQGTPAHRPLFTMVQCVEEARNFLKISNENILFFGSSAGGFQALQLHASFPGSRFLINNAQFDWSVYYERFVEEILRYSHPGLSLSTLKSKAPSSVNVLKRFCLPTSTFNGDYLINTASKIDYAHQLPVVNQFLSEIAEKPIAHFHLDVGYYHDPSSGHLPMKKAPTVQKLNESIEKIRKRP